MAKTVEHTAFNPGLYHLNENDFYTMYLSFRYCQPPFSSRIDSVTAGFIKMDTCDLP